VHRRQDERAGRDGDRAEQEREVAMNSALPRPQPARKPTIWLMLPLAPACPGEDSLCMDLNI
jgi:hypothetical protein